MDHLLELLIASKRLGDVGGQSIILTKYVSSPLCCTAGARADHLSYGRDLWRLLPTTSVRERTEQLQGINEVLQKLLSATQIAMDDLQTNAAKYTESKGLWPSSSTVNAQTLPDDIVRNILDLVDNIVPFSQVCGKFRRVALGSPGLWTNISSEMALSKTEAYLSRSQAMPLSIVLVPGISFDMSRSQSFVSTVLQHAHRIKSFAMNIEPLCFYSDEECFLNWMDRNELTGRAFPMLEHLKLDAGFDDEECYGSSEWDFRCSFRFIERWKMPNLRSLSTRNLLSCLIFEQGKVTSLQLEFVDHSLAEVVTVDTSTLLHILRTNPQLRRLSFTFANQIFEPVVGSLVEMENVESLEFFVAPKGPESAEIEDMFELMRHLVFPNLVSMKVHMEYV